jgi:hypothetical protein
MDSDEKRDLNVTHAVVNTLTAGYQGKFVALNVFQRIGSSRFEASEFDATRGVLDKIAVWIKALMDGKALLAGPGTETSPDRREALDLLRALKQDVSGLADEILRMRSAAHPADDREQTELLVAALLRHAYARDHYVKGLVAYSEAFGYEEAADRWRQHLLMTPREINAAHRFLDVLVEGSGIDKKFSVDLFEETLLLPYIFRCQVQDMNQVLAFYGPDFTYETAGITADEAVRWRNMKAAPEAACYWHAYGFTPGDTAAWVRAGFFEPGLAANWKHRGFRPDEAARWYNEGFEARAAAVSKVMGQKDPAGARAWLEAARTIESPD